MCFRLAADISAEYIVQGHRYNIYQDIGCLGETFETPVSVVLYHLPPILIGCVSGVFACTPLNLSNSNAFLIKLQASASNPSTAAAHSSRRCFPPPTRIST
jgi:pheromone a factor receptor